MASSSPDYNPTQQEILSRGEALRWMKLMQWPEDLVDSIMYDENPDLDTVRNMVYRLGPNEAKRRLVLMLRD